MTVQTKCVTWFDRVPTSGWIPSAGILVGGTWLLDEFFSAVMSAEDGGLLSIAAPFVGEGIARDVSAWKMMEHGRIDLTIVTQGRNDARTAWREAGDLAWRSAAVSILPRLHAKLYVFLRTSGGGCCLVGSHNLSHRGMAANLEAGVLFSAGNKDCEFAECIRDCHDHIMALQRKGSLVASDQMGPRDYELQRRKI